MSGSRSLRPIGAAVARCRLVSRHVLWSDGMRRLVPGQVFKSDAAARFGEYVLLVAAVADMET